MARVTQVHQIGRMVIRFAAVYMVDDVCPFPDPGTAAYLALPPVSFTDGALDGTPKTRCVDGRSGLRPALPQRVGGSVATPLPNCRAFAAAEQMLPGSATDAPDRFTTRLAWAPFAGAHAGQLRSDAHHPVRNRRGWRLGSSDQVGLSALVQQLTPAAAEVGGVLLQLRRLPSDRLSALVARSLPRFGGSQSFNLCSPHSLATTGLATDVGGVLAGSGRSDLEVLPADRARHLDAARPKSLQADAVAELARVGLDAAGRAIQRLAALRARDVHDQIIPPMTCSLLQAA
jgi:hypothetical protein